MTKKVFLSSLAAGVLLFSQNAYALFDESKTTTTTTTTTTSVSTINGSVDSILSNIGSFGDGLGGIFDSFGLDGIQNQITGDNELVGCLMQNVDLNSLLDQTAGLCSLLSLGNLNGGNFLTGGMIGCAAEAAGMDNMADLTRSLSSLCNTTAILGGGNSGWLNPSGGVIGTTTTTTVTTYSPMMTSTSTAPHFTGIKAGAESIDLSKAKFKNGETIESIYGEGGGIIERETVNNPNGSTAQSNKELDVPTIVLKELAATQVTNGGGDSELVNETIFGLPATQAKVIEEENKKATAYANTDIDLNTFQNHIVEAARAKFLKIEANTLSEYYEKEKKAYSEFLKNDEVVKIVKQVAYAKIEDKYATEMFLQKGEKNYLPDISETRTRRIHPEKQNQYRFTALLQMNKETLLKMNMAEEKERAEEEIDRTIKRAYSESSIFRSDIAKKEIDEMLKAVDTAIK